MGVLFFIILPVRKPCDYGSIGLHTSRRGGVHEREDHDSTVQRSNDSLRRTARSQVYDIGAKLDFMDNKRLCDGA